MSKKALIILMVLTAIITVVCAASTCIMYPMWYVFVSTFGFGFAYYLLSKGVSENSSNNKKENTVAALMYVTMSAIYVFLAAGIASTSHILVTIAGTLTAFGFLATFTSVLVVYGIPKDWPLALLVSGCECVLAGICTSIVSYVANSDMIFFISKILGFGGLSLFLIGVFGYLFRSLIEWCLKH